MAYHGGAGLKQRLVVALAALGIFILIVWPSTWNYPQAQGDPTRQRQTLDAIVNPRLTLTARGIVAQTATSMAGQLATNVAEMTMAIQTLRANLTETLIVQTATVTPSFTPT